MRVQTDNINLPANADLPPFVRVKLTGGFAALSGATDLDFGVTAERFIAAEGGTVCAVAPINSTGTIKMTAGAAIAVGAAVYGAADGKVGVITNANPIGHAVTAASGDGGYVEVMPRWGLPTT